MARIRRATAVKTSLTFRAVTLPLRTSARRPFGLDTALTSSRLLPPRQGHECSGRRCHGKASPMMPTGIDSHSQTPQHGDSAARQSPLWTPASSALVLCLLVSNTQRRPGTFHAAGCGCLQPETFLCGRGHLTPSGTGNLSPGAQHVPGREKMHPYAQHVPVGRTPGHPGQRWISTGPMPCPVPHPAFRPAPAAPRCARRARPPEAAAPGARARGGNAQWCW